MISYEKLFLPELEKEKTPEISLKQRIPKQCKSMSKSQFVTDST